jgi:hypothetical protein
VSPKKTLPVGGELVCAFMGKYAPEHQIIHLELPTMHKPLVIAPERLAVPCISESCLPSLFIDEVDIIMPELVLRGFVICLKMGDTMVISGGGIIASAPYTKKKGVSPVAWLDVWWTHSAHGSSSIHLAPSIFKQS